jgi:hypothetical protein
LPNCPTFHHSQRKSSTLQKDARSFNSLNMLAGGQENSKFSSPARSHANLPQKTDSPIAILQKLFFTVSISIGSDCTSDKSLFLFVPGKMENRHSPSSLVQLYNSTPLKAGCSGRFDADRLHPSKSATSKIIKSCPSFRWFICPPTVTLRFTLYALPFPWFPEQRGRGYVLL